jgi:transcriptional regulator with XRE-family HTH domain
MPPERRRKPRAPEYAALGEAIRQKRTALGLSQEELAEASDLHITHIGGLETGVRNPSYATLIRLARALETTPGSLLTLADELLEQSAKP